ncbi:MAG: hypothetical protein JOZ78_18130 [Chroococcidiopsidaceae cyanobacterium CP_BM_ER_R8_30]|nr:hypothetical protein [Chroococcidiopsidaceae cyanobacterium CP_BM_ER_R8_30]
MKNTKDKNIFSFSFRKITLTDFSRISLYLVVCGIGVFNLFNPTLLSGFERMQTDPGDTRVNNYFLEHSFQLLSNRNYIGELWSPAFFYPFKNVLALSDNLFGSAPIYWGFRTFLPPTTAFQLWVIAAAILCFASFVVLLRHYRVSHLLSAFGAFLFAFSMPRIGQLSHAQLLPQFFTPLAFLVGWEFVKYPTSKRLALLLLLTYLQVLAGIYLGWFWLFSSIIFFGIVYILDLSARTRLIRYCRSRYKAAIAIVLVWLGLMSLTLFPYVEIMRVIGARSYSEIDTMLPRLASWFSVPEGIGLWSPLLSRLSEGLPAVPEHHLFAGISIILLTGFSLLTLLRFKKLLTVERFLLIQACLIVFVILFILSLRLPSGLSLWRIVYEVVPGAKAIRSVTRVWTVAYFYLLIAVIVSFDSLLRTAIVRRRLSSALVSLLLILGIAEQIVLGSPSYEKAPYLREVADIQTLMQKDCNVAYVLLNPQVPFVIDQLTAMWAGIGANVPVINGYSGKAPPEYSGDMMQSMDTAQVAYWLGEGEKGHLCMISPSSLKLSDEVLSEYSIARNISPVGSFTSYTLQLPLPKIFSQEINVLEPPTLVEPDVTIELPVFVKNTSNFLWSPTGASPTDFSYHWVDDSGKVFSGNNVRTPLPHAVVPEEAVALNAVVKTPSQAGSYTLNLTMVQEMVAWFDDKGAGSPKIPITVTSP